MKALAIAPVPESEKLALWTMLQAYIAELAPIAGVKAVDGIHPYDHFDCYWQDEGRWAYWALWDGQRAGLALILRDADAGVFRVAEFYVHPQFRRTGLGREFARRLIERFPGCWKIRQMARNAGAVAFWRHTLAPFKYEEANFRDRGLERFEQSFVIPATKAES